MEKRASELAESVDEMVATLGSKMEGVRFLRLPPLRATPDATRSPTRPAALASAAYHAPALLRPQTLGEIRHPSGGCRARMKAALQTRRSRPPRGSTRASTITL